MYIQIDNRINIELVALATSGNEKRVFNYTRTHINI